jgi:addiction module RelE/StbE family toxin
MTIQRTKSFIKQFKKLPIKTQDQFIKRLKLFLSNNAHPYLKRHRLTGEYSGYWSFNVNADVRAVFKHEENTITFVAIGSHSQLYK